MPLFKSDKEKKYWLYVFLVITAIYSTIFLARPLIDIIQNDDIAAGFFLIAMALTGLMVIAYGIKIRISNIEISIWLGIAAVYIMLMLRLGVTERSHMIEYSALALLVHQALKERLHSQLGIGSISLIAIVLTSLIGAIDEFIQLFVPARVCDPIDIMFNSMASILAISAYLIIRWIRQHNRKEA